MLEVVSDALHSLRGVGNGGLDAVHELLLLLLVRAAGRPRGIAAEHTQHPGWSLGHAVRDQPLQRFEQRLCMGVHAANGAVEGHQSARHTIRGASEVHFELRVPLTERRLRLRALRKHLRVELHHVAQPRAQHLNQAALEGGVVARGGVVLLGCARERAAEADHALVAELAHDAQGRLLLLSIQLERTQLLVSLRVQLRQGAVDALESAEDLVAQVLSPGGGNRAAPVQGHEVVGGEIRELVAREERAHRQRRPGAPATAQRQTRNCDHADGRGSGNEQRRSWPEAALGRGSRHRKQLLMVGRGCVSGRRHDPQELIRLSGRAMATEHLELGRAS
mmetsp:Transcript_57617/g.166813  ORF Transcript_57617/g.166813 Transcript_57617/m.166813 type:complete len:335 (-) Transcript_57617:7-1011(-)